jgi:hypothetical protein
MPPTAPPHCARRGLTGLPVTLPAVCTLQALVVQAAGQLGLVGASAAGAHTWAQSCACMSCRTNLKKEKRQRNRVNAFRFKKGGFTPRRFNAPNYAAEAKKAEEDDKFLSMVRHRHHPEGSSFPSRALLLAWPQQAPLAHVEKQVAHACLSPPPPSVNRQVFTYSAEAAAEAEAAAKAAGAAETAAA